MSLFHGVFFGAAFVCLWFRYSRVVPTPNIIFCWGMILPQRALSPGGLPAAGAQWCQAGVWVQEEALSAFGRQITRVSLSPKLSGPALPLVTCRHRLTHSHLPLAAPIMRHPVWTASEPAGDASSPRFWGTFS